MTREEAIKVVRNIYQTDAEKEALETLVPELKESKEERTRKELIFFLKEEIPQCSIKEHAEKLKEFVSYLESQKEQKSLNISAASEWLRKHVCAYMNSEYNEFHKCVEYDGSIDKERLVNDFEEAMRKEQKPVVNIDQFKSVMLQYVQDAANRKDDSEIEEDTDKYAKKLFALAGIQQEGDDETEVQKAYREGKNAGRKEVFDHPEYYGLQLRRMYDYETGEKYPFVSYKDQLQKPWEWGEEETKILNSIIDDYEAAAKSFCGYDGKIGLLRAIRDGAYNLPKSEWSEEDKQWLSEVYFAIDHSMYSEVERQAMKEYIDFLRSQAKLKQERNEEDEKVRKWLLEYFYLHRDDLRGASVTSMEILSFLNRYDTEEDIDEQEFSPKPGEKFWVRCKTNKTVNLWFDKDDERPAYAVDADGIITYIVHIKKDGTGNCVSYQNKEKFLETFEIIKKP